MQSSSTTKSSGSSTAKKSKLLIIGSFIGISLLSCSDAQYQVVDHLLGIETPEKKDTVDIEKAAFHKLSELDTVPEFGTLDYFDATDTAFARLEEKIPKTHNPSTPPRKPYRRPRDRLSMRSDEIEKAFEEAKRKIAQMYDSTNH